MDAHTFESWLDAIQQWINEPADELRQMCTVNPEFLVMAQNNPQFFDLLNHSDVNVPDGVGLLIAAKILGKSLPERVTGSDGIYYICERAAQEGWSLYFLGAQEGIAAQAADILREKYAGLTIAGTDASNPDQSEAIIQRVNAVRPDILLVAYGAPRQDLWIDTHRDQLNVKVAMGIGGAFDFVSGVIPRAPLWMQNLGIEWLFRL
ncbi:MAG TPA: WecB/TagA/CpsF family glycosyltransferase, partial [Methylotenera sp.]|nr:WecB/TagA/CpsF family glycosyltransferase [Methylotenera sp.]